ncbi:beta strand repeat-containing protein [Haloferula rosea]|nr:PEP-CTERM sorting domain-containing protein [Haloferula rosea]
MPSFRSPDFPRSFTLHPSLGMVAATEPPTKTEPTGGGAAPADDLTTDIATFTGGSVDLSSIRQVAGLDFSSGSTLTGSGSIEIGSNGIDVGGNSTISTAGLVLNQATGVTLNGTLDISSVITGSGDLTVTAGSATALTITGTSGDDNSSGYTGNISFDGVEVVADRYAFGGGQAGKSIALLNGASLSANGNHLVLGSRDIVISGGASLIHSRNRNIYRFDGVVSGTGGLTYGNDNPSGAGSGKIQLDGTANTYTGGTTINTGATVWVSADGSLGAAGESLTIDDGIFYAKNDIYLNGRDVTIGAGGATISSGGGERVTMDGLISGTGDLTIQSGIFRFQSAGNTLSGNVTIDGTLVEVRTGSAGFMGTGTISLDNGAKLEGSANNTNMGSTTNIVIGSGGGTFQNAHARAFYNLGNATISGDGVLTLDGGGSTNANSRIQIAGMTNTLTTGLVMQNAANVQVGNDSDLGAAGSKVTIDNARMVTSEGRDFGSREFEIASGGGLLSLNNKTSTMSGPLTGSGALTIDTGSRNYGTTTAGGTLRLNSTGTHTGDVIVDGVNLEMSANNALGTGAVTLDNGAQLKNRDSETVLDNDVVIGAGGGELMAGWNKSLTVNGVVSGSGDLAVVSDSGTVILGGANTHTGNIDAGSSLRVTGSLGSGSYAGVISGAGNVEFAGGTTQTLSGANTYTGATMVTGGATLIVNGSLTSSLTTVESGSTLGGSGAVGALTVAAGANHNPGNSPGTMTIGGDYTLAGTLNVEVLGLTAGSEHDQLIVNGAVDLSGGSLVTAFSAGTYAENDLILILLNDGVDAITGTFAGLAEGAVVDSFGGFDWEISYVAGDGNDIGLVAVVPEPAITLLGGLGVLALLRRRRD